MKLRFGQFLFCLVIICIGIYSGLMLYENNQKVSAIIGSYQQENSSRPDDVTFTYSLGTNDFKAKDEGLTTYYLEHEFGAVQDFDATEHDYLIKVNNGLCQEMDNSAPGQVKGVYTAIFLNPDGTVAMEDELEVKVEFYLNQKTVLTITTDGGSEAVSFWAQYISNFGMMFQVVEV